MGVLTLLAALGAASYAYFVLKIGGNAANTLVTTARVGTVSFEAEDIDTGQYLSGIR